MSRCKLAHILRRELAHYYEFRESGKLAHLLPVLRMNICYMITGFPLGAGSGTTNVAHISKWGLCMSSLKQIDEIDLVAVDKLIITLSAAELRYHWMLQAWALNSCISHVSLDSVVSYPTGLFSLNLCSALFVCVHTCMVKCVSQPEA